MPTNTKFKGVDNFNDPLLSEQLETNLFHFFNWGFLEIGAFVNVTIPSSGNFGGYFHRLRLSSDPSYTAGRIWEGDRKDWVWETGIERDVQPIRVSGVYVNGTFQPVTGTGPYAHTINYPEGRIIFDSAISTSATVTCEYSYRLVHVYTAGMIKDFKKDIHFNSYRVDSSHFLQQGSGEWNSPPKNRVQLPAIVIDAEPITKRDGAELGNLVQNVYQDVKVHLYSETDYDYKKVHDVLTYQQEKTIIGFDKKIASEQQKLGLDFDGFPLPSSMMYPDLIKPSVYGGFGWRQIVFDYVSSVGSVQTKHPLTYVPIKMVCAVQIP